MCQILIILYSLFVFISSSSLLHISETEHRRSQKDEAIQLDSEKYLESDTTYSLPALKSSLQTNPRVYCRLCNVIFHFNTRISWKDMKIMHTCYFFYVDKRFGKRAKSINSFRRDTMYVNWQYKTAQNIYMQPI